MVHSQDFYKMYQETFEKYTNLYGAHVCVFLLKGSFYELYGIYDPIQDRYENTVKEVADLLDLQLKVYPNDVKGGKTGLFGGVPDQSIHKWAGKLSHMGWTCVLIDQIKSASGQVEKREVARVLSPGTHIEVAESDESVYVSAISVDGSFLDRPPSYSLASIESATGQVILYEANSTGTLSFFHCDTGAQMCATYVPKEVYLFWKGSPMYCLEESEWRIRFQIPSHVPLHIRRNEEGFEEESRRQDYLTQTFHPKTLMPIRPWLGTMESPHAEQLSLIHI